MQLKTLTVMESERSSSDAALRMLFVEDVELLEFGISEQMKVSCALLGLQLTYFHL